jgi:hypothetical protein
MEIPHPFVTQGATPMHVYDGELVGLTDAGGYDPVVELMSEKYMIREEDWLQPPGYVAPDYLSCKQVSGPNGSGNCIVSIFVPQAVIDSTVTDSVYINLHLDFAFKGNFTDLKSWDLTYDRYDRGGNVSPWDSSDALVDTVDNTGELAIADCTVYHFAHYTADDPQPVHEDAVENLNAFKRFTGVFGEVACDDGNPIADGIIILQKADSAATVMTADVDGAGFYRLGYQHKGKASAYQLQWCDDDLCTNTHTTGAFLLQSDGVIEVNLEATDLCDDLDGPVGASDWLAITLLYASGKFANQ